jgi:hypothetical protein
MTSEFRRGFPAASPPSSMRKRRSSDAGECNIGGHGWLWEKGGPPVELTSLIPADANVHIMDARNINDAGEIAAIATLPNGDQHAVLLIPIDRDDCEDTGCEPDRVRACWRSRSQHIARIVRGFGGANCAAPCQHLRRNH